MKKAFDALFEKYAKEEYLSSDPIFFPKQFTNKQDIEIVAFISALFSYGNVVSIKKFLENLFYILTPSPFSYLKYGDINEKSIISLKYRFQTGKDIFYFLKALHKILQTKSSLESLFGPIKLDIQTRILQFQNEFKNYLDHRSYGLDFLIGKGIKNSSNKRLNMFLRWMTRKNFPDFGIYTTFKEEDLLYPTDVHIIKLSQALGITNLKSINSKFTKEISNYFKNISPKDPVKYDFALTRLGILKECKTEYYRSICSKCELKKICKIYPL